MKKILFVLASTASLTWVDLALAQYVPPSLGGATPGYNWREDRVQGDWRNNTWREERAKADWRNNTWREKRENEDFRGRDDYTKNKARNNATGTGINTEYGADCNARPAGSSTPPCR